MEVFLISVARALVEVAGYSLLGQGIVGFLAGAKRESNGVYRLFRIVTGPVTSLVRRLTPRALPDRYIPQFTFLLLVVAWIALAIAKRSACLSSGLACA